MNKFKNPIIAAAVLTGLGIIGSLMNSHPAVLQAAGGPTVTIDPAQLPLHVTGSTTVAGTVAATQSGPWNVGISGNTTINPLLTRSVDNPPRQPFQISGTIFPPDFPGSFTVPSGHRLVIQDISLELAIPNPTLINEVWVTATANVAGSSTTTTFLVFPTLHKTVPGPNTGLCACAMDYYGLNQQVTIYADGGTTVSINASRYSSNGPFQGPFSVSGYLE